MERADIEEVLEIVDKEIKRKIPGETNINNPDIEQSTQVEHVDYTDTAPGETNINIGNNVDSAYTTRSVSTYNDIQKLANLASLIEQGAKENEGKIKESLDQLEGVFTRAKDFSKICSLLPFV